MISVKTAKEIERMKKACKISADALWIGGQAVKPGITTRELDNIIFDYIQKQGARPTFKGYGGFPGTACISVNDTVIHGIPGDYTLQEGDIVSIDTGAEIGGFTGDNAATFACGKISDEAKELLLVTREALHRGIAAALPGNRVGDIGAAVQTYAEKHGFSVVREFVGHGVGRHLHEDPNVPNYGKPGTGPRLVSGMTIAIEPMICENGRAVKTLSDGWTVKTRDGGLAAHFEHSIAITPNGPLVLTKEWENHYEL